MQDRGQSVESRQVDAAGYPRQLVARLADRLEPLLLILLTKHRAGLLGEFGRQGRSQAGAVV